MDNKLKFDSHVGSLCGMYKEHFALQDKGSLISCIYTVCHIFIIVAKCDTVVEREIQRNLSGQMSEP